MKYKILRGITTIFSAGVQLLINLTLEKYFFGQVYGLFVVGNLLSTRISQFIDPSISNYFFLKLLKNSFYVDYKYFFYYTIFGSFGILIISLLFQSPFSIYFLCGVLLFVFQWSTNCVTKISDASNNIFVEIVRLIPRIILFLLCFYSIIKDFNGVSIYYFVLTLIFGIIINIYYEYHLANSFIEKGFFSIRDLTSFVKPMIFSTSVVSVFTIIEIQIFEKILGTSAFSDFGLATQLFLGFSIISSSTIQLLTKDYQENKNQNHVNYIFWIIFFIGIVVILIRINTDLLSIIGLGKLPIIVYIITINLSVVNFRNQWIGNLSMLNSGSIEYSRSIVIGLMTSIFVIVIIAQFNFTIWLLFVRQLIQTTVQNIYLIKKMNLNINNKILSETIFSILVICLSMYIT